MSASPQDGSPLRLGLYLDSLRQPAWVHRLIADVESHGVGVFVVAVIDPVPRRPARWSGLHRLYLTLDARLFRPAPNQDWQAASDLSGALGRCDVVHGQAQAAAAVAGADLDVLFVVGPRPPQAVLQAPRHGAWTFAHGVNDAGGFVEVLHQHPATASVLARVDGQRLNEEPQACSWTATERRSTSRTHNRALAKSSGMAVAALARLRAGLPAPVCPVDLQPVAPLDGKAAPGNAAMASLLANFVWRYARDKYLDWQYREQWALGLRWGAEADGPAFDEPPSDYVMPPLDRFWADPFPFEANGRHFVFVEEFLFDGAKGHISVLEVDAGGLRGRATPVVVEAHHLSYPNVFSWNGSIYMTPECQAAGRIDLYRAVDFPWTWERMAPLMTDVIAADPTIFRHDDGWWMFVNLGQPGSPNYDDCHLFWADELEGPWRPHPLNPVRSDARCARPAGRVFTREGKLYRPAQDCAVRYGYAVAIHEIERITRTEYREREVARVEPTWRPDLIATHTLNSAGRLTVWDCMFQRRRRTAS